MTTYFIFAGEPSGDLHGSQLLHSLQEKDPTAKFEGVGGPLMRQQGLTPLVPMEDFQVMGFTSVFQALPRLIHRFYKIRSYILKTSPACVILIDYPGFNLRLAKSLRSKGFKGKIIQYIAPTVWAHGKERIQTLTKNYDLLLTILPFEATLFSHTSLKTTYIGHPLVNIIRSHPYQKEWFKSCGLSSKNHLIALFPGSRKSEITLHLPEQLEAIIPLIKEYPYLCFVICCAQDTFSDEIKKMIKEKGLILNKNIFIVSSSYRYELMKDAHAALSKSGTVALELALHQTPSVIHYHMTRLNYWLAKYFLKVDLPYYCLVNILGNQLIFPEFIEKQGSSEELSQSLEALIIDTEKRAAIIKKCRLIESQLDIPYSDEKSAEAILAIKNQ